MQHKSQSRRVLPRVLTFVAMLFAAALLVSSSIPANAFMRAEDLAATATADVAQPLQKMTVDTAVVAAPPPRDAYTVVSLAEQLKAKYGNQVFSYTNNPNGTIQWPFPIAVPIGSGFGDRQVAGCGFCSTFHEGVDFNPGVGTDIQAIADGVVSKVAFDRGGLGNNVTIDHVINGKRVQSVYGHMLADSVRMVEGQVVKVTEIVGQVGSTGASTGAHLHLEIHLDGTPVDPYAWLKANAN
jgi:murein DD-endopeptidase MepM/ murein hydrolase activator NlpD